MPCGPISIENLEKASATHDPTKTIYMLNLWRFRDTASYLPEHAALAGEPCTGQEAMARYRAAIQPCLPPNSEVFFIGNTITQVVAPREERWDLVAVIKYEAGLKGFKEMVESQVYKDTAEPHRLAGLEDFRLIMVDRSDV
ncbi:hypothetical protein IQ07DRAFT_12685 [Pyrenochaeta sp. DS3sAY3a]|nr:hypothetical protein IQ07DRAFT_12685 [Pyrenochaeta sp. DS3sAY3a]